MTRVGKKASSCGKKVENWRKNKCMILNLDFQRPQLQLELVDLQCICEHGCMGLTQ